MKYLADTHVHTIFSFDGQMSMEKAIIRALSFNLKYIAFTEHLELNQISIEQFINRFKIYNEELQKLQEKYKEIRLISGVEFSNPEIYQKELDIINNLPLDYVIGSNHIYPKNYNEKSIEKYYLRILKMVKNGGIDCLGHIDYIKRHYDDNCISDDLIKEIFKYAIKNDISIEINSSAKRRCNIASFPDNHKIELYKETGGSKVTIGSDAHRISEIYDNIDNIDNNYDLNKGLYLNRKYMSLSN